MTELTIPFEILSFVTALLMLHVMQQTNHDPASKTDSVLIQNSRRLAYVSVICGLAWNISYHDSRAFPPSPSEMLIVIGIGMLFLVRAVILFQHRKDRVPRRRDQAIHQ